MDMTCYMTSVAKQSEVVAALTRQGYKVTPATHTVTHTHSARVWRVDEADEDGVIATILHVDPGAMPHVPPGG